ncbi:hypothetical protein EXU85_10010 [Spirosoma sp. KCTC 42546]|uniref:hypothetical protein n=1 Tax=Spirosoma sp. KCTC 42546 TaxID=2520506 RepID=UPI001159B220|nr:hypothetical protein [Spirosoma sp. KCTC 42546]QDK78921.1 hypothetical protein EXU85_10010 [Spirosoma sp. KCTC 42546]
MNTFSKQLFTALFGLVILASCSRPVAYFQPTAREHSVSTTPPATPLVADQTPVDQTPAVATSPAQQLAQANSTLNEVDALVSTNNKLAVNKTVQKRLNRVRALLASASTKASLNPTEVAAPKKMNLMERLMVKKMNKKISKQLAPNNPDKAMINSGTLATGAVLVIVGLLLILLTTGTAFTVGVIALLAGAVLLLVGLL